MASLHDKLQAQCFLWSWNERPETRYCLWSNMNNLTTQLPKDMAMRIMAIRRSLGMIKGVTDFVFYWKGRLYAMDIKIGKDRLRPEQKEYISAISKQGGEGREIRSFEEFKGFVDLIIGYGLPREK